MGKIKISPSLACADCRNLEHTVRILEQAGADMLHFDIEDGNFVPVMTLGTRIIQDLRPITSLPFDVHLMVRDPEKLSREIIQYGVNALSFHWEAHEYPRRLLRIIREADVKAGIAFNPKTPIPDIQYLEPYLDFVVVLTSEPEHENSHYLPDILLKIEKVRKQFPSTSVDLAVDGGINLGNIETVVTAGADILVVGRGVFLEGRISQNLSALKKRCAEL
jgi:ribulose-phosphate 3-epimerase